MAEQNAAPEGIPQETLDKIEREYLCKTLKEIPSSPMITDELLDTIPRKYLDLPYGDDPKQKIDLYLPPAQLEPVPMLAFIHGGAFVAGNKRDMQVSVYWGLLNKGYAVASIGYRLAPGAHFPDPIKDVKAGLRYLKAHAHEYGVDPARIAVAGGSSGANYALMLAATPNIDYLEDKTTGDSAYDTTVPCAVAAYPVVDFTTMGEQHEANGTGKNEPAGPNIPECLYLGGVLADFEASHVARTNPTTYLTPQIPPLMIRAGRLDALVPYQQSENFAAKAKEIAGEDRVDFKLVEGVGHADPPFKEPSYLEEVYNFLEKHLR